MNTSKAKLKFDNSELSENGLASGSICGDGTIIYAIDKSIADICGAELFSHEFNEVEVYQTIKKLMIQTVMETHKQFKSSKLPITEISHNLNAESNSEYIKERYLLEKYIPSDRLPAIDHIWTPEETNEIRAIANKPRKQNP
jgi:hypothetical protein